MASAAGALTSCGGVLALLDDPDQKVQTFALKKLNTIVNTFWAEIANAVEKLEILYEDEGFGERSLAALVTSKVYYHLGEYDDSRTFALYAGNAFDVNENSEFVNTIIAQCIDKYTALRKDGSEEIDPALEAIVNRMFKRCFDSQEYRQAAGIALEARRVDMLERAIVSSGDVEGMLGYVYKVVQTLIINQKFRKEVLRILARLYAELPSNTGIFKMCQCYIFLNDPEAVTGVLLQLVASGHESLATQLAFDLYDSATQHFLLAVSTGLTNAVAAQEGDKKQLERLVSVLAGDWTKRLNVEFLSRNNHADMRILKNTKAVVGRSSVFHSALVLSNSVMYAGTASEAFLRDDPQWITQANNWAKFSVVASLGVIHRDHIGEAMNVLAPYLPKDGAAGNPYEAGGGLYALGLIYSNHGAGIIDYLTEKLDTSGTSGANNAEVVQHGGCLGLGLAAMGTAKADIFEKLKGMLFADSALAGESAGIAMGLVMLGSGDAEAVNTMIDYARETQHEKIIRGLALGVALVMYDLQEAAESTIERLLADKDALLRMSAVHTLAMAYIGTNENQAIKRLLHLAVSDVSDDVRRAAVTALGFVLCRTPEQVPSVVSLLSESFNPHVRYGSCMALAIACAGTGLSEALALIEPMIEDTVGFVRQGAYVATAMIMMQQPNSHPKAESTRKLFAKVVADKHEDVLAKFGAIYAQGLIEAGGRNGTVSLLKEGGHVHTHAAVGLLVFTGFWYWFPLSHFLSLAMNPSAMIVLNSNLQMPKMQFRSNAPPSAFAYPPPTEEPKEKAKEKVETAILSITAKTKANKKKKEGESGKMDVDDAAKKPEAAAAAEADAKKPAEPEPEFCMLDNPARVVRPQLAKISFEADGRYHPVRPGALRSGIVIVTDGKPDEPQDILQMSDKADAAPDAASTENEPGPPEPFDFDESVDE